jgi:hypothetical protein
MFNSRVILIICWFFHLKGTTIKPLVKLIGVKLERPHKQTMNEVIHLTVSRINWIITIYVLHHQTIDHIVSGVEEITGNVGFNSVTVSESYLLLIMLHFVRSTYTILTRNT